MANEPKVPEVRDDDPEDVADKLSIAAAMWGRGDRADAIMWVRRAAESASDAEQDMRALELAKAASELASLGAASQSAVPAAAPAPAAAAPPPRPKTAPPPKPSFPPTATPGKAPTAAASTIPKKTAPPAPGSRPPGSKLPPLPPIRPLGTPTPAPPQKAPRLPSMITSAMGAVSASGTVQRDDTPPPPEAGKPMPWDEAAQAALVDDEPTKQIAIEPTPGAPHDLEETREIAAIAMQPAREEELPLAVGVRVRVLVAADGVHIVPEGETREGISAVIVPLDANDDLRSLFQRRAGSRE